MGLVGRPHGVRGAVVVHDETDNPRRFGVGSSVFTEDGTELRIVSVDPTDTQALKLVRFEGVEDREAAEELRGSTLWIEAGARRTLDPDEFWPDDLEGLEVRTPEGAAVGRVLGVVEGAAQDRLLVGVGEEEVEVPFVPAIVTVVDLDHGYVVVEPIPGLLPTPPQDSVSS